MNLQIFNAQALFACFVLYTFAFILIFLMLKTILFQNV